MQNGQVPDECAEHCHGQQVEHKAIVPVHRSEVVGCWRAVVLLAWQDNQSDNWPSKHRHQDGPALEVAPEYVSIMNQWIMVNLLLTSWLSSKHSSIDWLLAHCTTFSLVQHSCKQLCGESELQRWEWWSWGIRGTTFEQWSLCTNSLARSLCWLECCHF